MRCVFLYFRLAQQPDSGRSHIIVEASRLKQWHTTVGRTPLNEGSARRRDLCQTHTALTRDRHRSPRYDFCSCFLFFPLLFKSIMYIYILCPHVTTTQHPCPIRGFFLVFSCTLYFIRTWFFGDCPAFRLCHYSKYTTQASMPFAGFEPTIPGNGRPQTLALDRSATGIGHVLRLGL